MITNVGQQILSELKSEQAMDVADKKWWFVFKDVGSVPHFVWGLFKVFFGAIFVYTTALLILAVVMLDEQSLELLLSQPLAEIISLRDNLVRVAGFLTTLATFFYTFQYWRNYVNIKQQYQSDNEIFYQDQKLQIELIEEVLDRHKLIDRKDA
ncbi:hypothetical protein L1D14_10590 [Vibrio tubiashii]|uniref:hypothetical protein n=1 Tax=Vibrio tubiashii TaxID=29498 RepID=UPI001EFD16BF|nr:hypothetical protein [Vibrio tubiashii]MCG9576685.1 hypothetical protein [Vibrio tubiashii]